MSKFLQKTFGMTNATAGSLASIPYLFASLTVPLFGSILSVIGQNQYELALTCSPLSILTAHSLFMVMSKVFVDA